MTSLEIFETNSNGHAPTLYYPNTDESDTSGETGVEGFAEDPYDDEDVPLGLVQLPSPTAPDAQATPGDSFSPSVDLSRLTGYDLNSEQSSLPTGVSTEEDEDEDEVSAHPLSTPGSSDEDEEEEEVADPRAVKTKHGIIGSPLTKLLFVGAGSLIVILAMGAFLSSVMGDHSSKSPVVAVSPSPSPTVSPTDNGEQDDLAKYKTESALARQKELLNGAAKPQPLPTPSASPKATAAPVPLASPIPMPAAPATTLVAAPIPPPVVSPVDPMEKWRMAAQIGSYGQVPGGSASAYTALQPSQPVAPVTPIVPVSTPVSSSGARSITQLRASSSTPGLRDRPLSSVLVGSTATALLLTAIVMTGDNTTPVNPDSPTSIKYLAKLNAPLNDAEGSTAIPVGSQLVLVARSFSPQSGLAEFVVTSVIVDGKEYSVPKDSLVVRGANGGLVAFSKRGGGGGLFQSILPAFFAGVSQAGQILNQPSSSATVSGGSVSVTTTSNNPSPLAGFAQGFGQNLSQTLQQRAQLANQAAASAPNSWQLGAGSEVKVFVNSSFEM